MAAEAFFSWWASQGDEDSSSWDGVLCDEIDAELPGLSPSERPYCPPSPLHVGSTAAATSSLVPLPARGNGNGNDDDHDDDDGLDGDLCNNERTSTVGILGGGDDADGGCDGGRERRAAFPGDANLVSGGPRADVSVASLPAPTHKFTGGSCYNLGQQQQQQQQALHLGGGCYSGPACAGSVTSIADSAAAATSIEGALLDRSKNWAENVAFGWLQQVRRRGVQVYGETFYVSPPSILVKFAC